MIHLSRKCCSISNLNAKHWQSPLNLSNFAFKLCGTPRIWISKMSILSKMTATGKFLAAGETRTNDLDNASTRQMDYHLRVEGRNGRRGGRKKKKRTKNSEGLRRVKEPFPLWLCTHPREYLKAPVRLCTYVERWSRGGDG